MAVQTTSIANGYISANKVRTEMGIQPYALLRLVASGLVKVKVAPGFYPFFCLADLRKHSNTLSGKHKPDARTGKKRKDPT